MWLPTQAAVFNPVFADVLSRSRPFVRMFALLIVCALKRVDALGAAGVYAPSGSSLAKKGVRERPAQRTRSPLGHPRCRTWAEEVPLRTRRGATVSGSKSNVTAMPPLSDPHKRALLPTPADKTLERFIVPHQQNAMSTR